MSSYPTSLGLSPGLTGDDWGWKRWGGCVPGLHPASPPGYADSCEQVGSLGDQLGTDGDKDIHLAGKTGDEVGDKSRKALR